MPRRHAHKHPMRERFCQEVLKDGLPNPAAKRAGYTGRNAGTILMGLEDVQKRVKAMFQSQMRRLQMSADDVVIGFSRIARFDPACIYAVDGTILPIRQWPIEARMCLDSIDYKEGVPVTVEGEDGKPQVIRSTYIHKVKFSDRMQALVALARHHNLFAEEARAVGHGISQGMAELVHRAQQDGGGVTGLLAGPKPEAEPMPVEAIAPPAPKTALPLPRRNPLTLQ